MRDHREEIDGIEAHPHHIKRFVCGKGKVESHDYFSQSFQSFFEGFEKRVRR